jgi:zinc transporter 9
LDLKVQSDGGIATAAAFLQALLRVGVVKAMKAPTARHNYGYMRDRFVWSLISAVGIFFLGAGASVFHGLHTLTETRVVEGAMWSYIGEQG